MEIDVGYVIYNSFFFEKVEFGQKGRQFNHVDTAVVPCLMLDRE